MAERRILLIDDDPQTRQTIRSALRDKGYSVHEADDGRIGLDMIDEVRPDLVILDIILPGMSGMDLCRRLRTHPEHNTVPIIIVSDVEGDNRRPEEFWRQGLGVDEFVAKSGLEMPDLVGRIEYLLRRGSYRSVRGEPSSPRPMPSPGPPVAPDMTTLPPEDVVRCFIEAWNTSDFSLEFACLSPKLIGDLSQAQYVARRREVANNPDEAGLVHHIEGAPSVRTDAESASVEVRRQDERDGRRFAPRREVYSLEPTGHGWKIGAVTDGQSRLKGLPGGV